MDGLRTALENIAASFSVRPAPEPHDGFVAALMNRLSSVVRVRRSGELDWPAAAAKALYCHAALKAGSLDTMRVVGPRPGHQPARPDCHLAQGARARLPGRCGAGDAVGRGAAPYFWTPDHQTRG